MRRKHHKPEEIVAKLRQVEVLTGQGRSIAEAARSIEVRVRSDPAIIGLPELTGSLDQASSVVGLKPRLRQRMLRRGSSTAGTAPDFGKLPRCHGTSFQ